MKRSYKAALAIVWQAEKSFAQGDDSVEHDNATRKLCILLAGGSDKGAVNLADSPSWFAVEDNFAGKFRVVAEYHLDESAPQSCSRLLICRQVDETAQWLMLLYRHTHPIASTDYKREMVFGVQTIHQEEVVNFVQHNELVIW